MTDSQKSYSANNLIGEAESEFLEKCLQFKSKRTVNFSSILKLITVVTYCSEILLGNVNAISGLLKGQEI
jgi:hypothetical protein